MIDTFDVKKRAYIGNTTMEAEVSLLMANQALAAKGKLIYDPFSEPIHSVRPIFSAKRVNVM